MPSLWYCLKIQVTNKILIIDKKSLRISFKKNQKFHPEINPPKETIKRVSRCLSPLKRASMTLEAAIVLPIFLFFFINILSFLDAIRLQSDMTMILRETGMPMTVYGHIYKDAADGDEKADLGGISFSYAYVIGKVKNFLNKEYPQKSPLVIMNVSTMERNDMIDLSAVYKVEPTVKIVGYPELYVFSRFYGRAFTGYDVTNSLSNNVEEKYVYVTETGQTYHLRLNCSHLQLSITTTKKEKLDTQRNESGEIYKPCELCQNIPSRQFVFITETGNKYHNSIRCKGLKRTIKTIPLSSVGDRKLCKRCGNS